MNRYIVEEGSRSGHCCFKWSIVDTNKEKYSDPICECYEKEDAENICNLLNKVVDTADHP